MNILNKVFAGSTAILILTSLILFGCLEEERIPVTADFNFVADQTKTAPATIALNNTTSGADVYQWTFVGATPASSNKKDPGTISYNKAGTYKIVLEAWNDHSHSNKELTIQFDSAVALDFTAEILVNDFAPATVQISNNTNFDVPHEWSFEGGSPASSALPHPGNVTFHDAGEHIITLKIQSGNTTITSSQTVLVKPALSPGFNIEPIFDDLDYEAPVKVSLVNTTISGVTYTWSSTGGLIELNTAENTSLVFSTAGTYAITLTASNGKETKTMTRTITVSANSNLYTITNARFGISGAHNTTGCYYTTTLRDIVSSDEINDSNSHSIDLVFYAINSSFDYCRFISPDVAADVGLPPIPSGSTSWFVNVIENTGLSFTVSDFQGMTTDAALKTLSIKGNDTGSAYFTDSIKPRIVLFETDDGRKGAIHIKDFLVNGSESYVLSDIKIQKAKS